MTMSEYCDYLLAWFMSMYQNESGELPEMSAEVYDRAVFIVGVGVPMALYICVIIAVCVMLYQPIALIRGKR